MLQLKSVVKDYGEKTVLDNVNIVIYDYERIGIVGNNGQGKSTLLNIITQNQKPDSGEVVSTETFGFLKQSSEFNEQEILEELSNASHNGEFLKQLKKMNYQGDFDLSVEKIKNLSCGERGKIALALAFAKNPTTLILDEPTNHLDISTKKLIIEQVNAFCGTVIIVSHDKDFLNQTVTSILEINNGKITKYNGNYDFYEQEKARMQLEIKRTYAEHKQKVGQIESKIETFQSFAKKVDAGKHHKSAQRAGVKCDNGLRADVVSSKFSRKAADQINKLKNEINKNVQKPELEHQIKYKLTKDNIQAKVAFNVKDLGVNFGSKTILKDVNFVINSGDKIAVVGDNGTGKTTLIKILLGQMQQYEGIISKTPSLKIANMFQDVYDLNEDMTINQISMSEDKEFRTSFITNLVSMNFDKSRFDIKIKYLSSGEKMRIKLNQLILTDANMIILDEPTNHLDIMNKNYLEKVLSGFQGTVVIVSHDIEFLKNTTTRTFLIQNKTLKIFEDNVANII